ncbi:MAG: DUF421 domain-containing protein [Clostridia bacterium]|nr:DUF421 domain-containing protein [Clostridia bacterium]
MLTLLFRTIFIYVFLILIMRLMGKRQLGELEMTDLVITLLLSEIATVPLTDPTKPLLHAVIPVTTLALLEVLASFLSLKLPFLRSLLSPKPAIIVHNGRIDRQQMQKARISLDELMCELRQKDVCDLNQVLYAIMESSGKISVIKKSAESPLCASQLGLQVSEPGMMRIVFCDGVYAAKTLRAIGRDKNWVNKQIKKAGLCPDSVFYVTADDAGNVRIQKK